MTTVTYSCDNGLAHILLNRPHAANAIDLPTARAFGDAVSRARADDDARAVLVSGAGARFCAGGDVASMVAATDRAGHVFELAEVLDGALQELARMEKPVVAAVQGAVAGAGLGVMLSCDVVVADAGTRFVFAYPAVGLTPDCGVSWLLPRAVGQQRALELALTGRVLDAPAAMTWGLVTEVVADGALERAAAVGQTWAAGPSGALGEARRLLRSSWDRSRAEAGAMESRTIARAVRSEHATDALESFMRGR